MTDTMIDWQISVRVATSGSHAQTSGFYARNHWFLHQKPMVTPFVLSTTPSTVFATPSTVFATPSTVICQSIIVSVSLHLSYIQRFMFKIDRLTVFSRNQFFWYLTTLHAHIIWSSSIPSNCSVSKLPVSGMNTCNSALLQPPIPEKMADGMDSLRQISRMLLMISSPRSILT